MFTCEAGWRSRTALTIVGCGCNTFQFLFFLSSFQMPKKRQFGTIQLTCDTKPRRKNTEVVEWALLTLVVFSPVKGSGGERDPNENIWVTICSRGFKKHSHVNLCESQTDHYWVRHYCKTIFFSSHFFYSPVTVVLHSHFIKTGPLHSPFVLRASPPSTTQGHCDVRAKAFSQQH